MSGPGGERRSTWRADRYSPCSRLEAGVYLGFLASVGYELAPIEQAVADGVPYTGDHPGEPLITALGSEVDGAGEPVGLDGVDLDGSPDGVDSAGDESAAA
jgi:ParB family chromosome partitioning protein